MTLGDVVRLTDTRGENDVSCAGGDAVGLTTCDTKCASVIVLTNPASTWTKGVSLHESSRRASATGHSVCAQNVSVRIKGTPCARGSCPLEDDARSFHLPLPPVTRLHNVLVLSVKVMPRTRLHETASWIGISTKRCDPEIRHVMMNPPSRSSIHTVSQGSCSNHVLLVSFSSSPSLVWSVPPLLRVPALVNFLQL